MAYVVKRSKGDRYIFILYKWHMWSSVAKVTDIYNTCALSKHMGNMCMRLRNAGKGEASPRFFPAFRAEYTYLPICFDSAHVLYLSCNSKS